MATSAPGYSSILPKNKAPLAMTMKRDLSATVRGGMFRLDWPHRGLMSDVRATQEDSMPATVVW
jgi:hypothetical protein